MGTRYKDAEVLAVTQIAYLDTKYNETVKDALNRTFAKYGEYDPIGGIYVLRPEYS